jgi:drug/metabolite transporter (DMT)-like permease
VTASPAVFLALLAAACFGAALIVIHFGLRHATPYVGARIGLTTTFVLWWLLAPLLLDLSAWHAGAAAVFAIVGLFYPAAVTVITYESNRLIGPTLTGTISSCTPLFATALAVLLLGEPLTAAIAAGGFVIVAALVLLSWQPGARIAVGWRLILPLSGAALRAVAQALGKIGLTLWPNPFAATLIGYTVSGAAIWSVPRKRAERSARHFPLAAVPWFAVAGILNGSALLLLNHALQAGRVSLVAPLVALYPLFTMLFSALLVRSEALTRRTVSGALLAIAGVAILVSA